MDTTDGRRSVVERVVERTADRLDRDPLDLEPLGTVVDPGLLRAVVVSDAVLPASEVRFRYCGFEVRVCGDGDVELEECE